MDEAERYRAKAAEIERIAEEAATEAEHDAYLEIARGYLQLAGESDAHADPSPRPLEPAHVEPTHP